MELNVAQLLKSPVGTTREADLEPGEELQLDDETLATVDAGHVRLDRTNQGILARGTVHATVNATCSRCLDAVNIPVRITYAEEFEPTVEVNSGRPLPPSGDEMRFSISPNHILDLREAIRQNLIPAIPMQPLCKPDCSGLCPTCGANRNTSPCDCKILDQPPDEDATYPLASLAELLKKQPG